MMTEEYLSPGRCKEKGNEERKEHLKYTMEAGEIACWNCRRLGFLQDWGG
jgi:hypothetical protein